MLDPQDVDLILRLHKKKWGKKRIAKELGISKHTVTRYIKLGCWQPYTSEDARQCALDPHLDWLKQAFFTHHGNAAVLAQLLEDKGVDVSLRSIQRAVKPWRDELRLQQKATVRFETAPGEQMQVDFGSRRVMIAGQVRKVYLAVITLAFSRRMVVYAFEHERRDNWLTALERAFFHFQGLPEHLLVDNARALVLSHDPQQGEVVFNSVFLDFCRFWGVTPRACRPYRARTKGKVERGVGYVKHNALAGHEFESWQELHAHLDRWVAQVADVRVHGTTHERPIDRFNQFEKQALTPIDASRAYPCVLIETRRVHNDACVLVARNHYSVPCELIGRQVVIKMNRTHVEILHRDESVARHPRLTGHGERQIQAEHHKRLRALCYEREVPDLTMEVECEPELLRPLSEYQALLEEVMR